MLGTPPISAIPLPEVIAEVTGVGPNSKKVQGEYMRLLTLLGNEFSILFDTSLDEIERHGSATLADAIARMRAGNICISPGYDGEYGKVMIFEENAKRET